MEDELKPAPITGELVLKVVPLTLTDQMERTAIDVYERYLAMGLRADTAVKAAVHGAIVAAPTIDVAELRIAPMDAVILTWEWLEETRKVLERCKFTDGPDSHQALRELRGRVERIVPSKPPGDWRGSTTKGN